MKKTDIEEMLAKAVQGILSDEETSTEKDSSLSKEVKALNAQMTALAKAAAAGFEKPKTMEEMVKDAISPLAEQVTALAKKVNGESEDANEPVPQTMADLKKAIADVVTESLKDTLGKSTKAPKGEGKDDLSKDLKDLSNEDAAELLKSLLSDDSEDDDDDEVSDSLVSKLKKKIGKKDNVELCVETTDQNGNDLTKEQRAKRAKLDDFFGKTISRGAERMMGKDVDVDEEDDDE